MELPLSLSFCLLPPLYAAAATVEEKGELCMREGVEGRKSRGRGERERGGGRERWVFLARES